MMLLFAAAPAFVAPPKEGLSVLVTGAAGRTGKILYGYLKADSRIKEVRALVYGSGAGSPDERKTAAAALKCTQCDASEGIYYGDVTKLASLTEAFEGMDTVAIVTAAGGGAFNNDTLTKEVEFNGVENQVAAIVAGSSDVTKKHVVLCSAMGTGISPFANSSSHHGPPSFLKGIMFWKLNAEAFLGSSAIPNSIVKPCGLDATYGRGGKELLVGHDDTLPHLGEISREDTAAVMLEAVVSRANNLRFDLCVGNGAPTKDLGKLLDDARFSWQK
jgi:nucleoside-diphosphate-sugar epimerase